MESTIVNLPRVTPRRPVYQSAKRFVDLIFVITFLPIYLPLLILCALAIWLNSRGPVFFVQERIGKGEQRFRIYKFRTMNVQHEEKENQSFMKAYVRGKIDMDKAGISTFKPITPEQTFPVGRFLRKTSLDELPQLINVLKREMSIVGPRPNVPYEVEEYYPWHYERLEVLPGITGQAQINGRSDITFDSIVRYDINYIEHQSLALDLKIIWNTVKSVLLSKGAG